MNPHRILMPSIEVLKNKSDAYNCENQNEKAYSVIFSEGILPPTACTFRVAADEA